MWRFKRSGAVVVAAVMVGAWGGSAARGWLYLPLELERLVDNSAQIVEAEIREVSGAEAKVEVTRVYRGDAREKEVLKVNVGVYQKPGGTGGSGTSLDVGDKLILFLRWDRSGGQSVARADDSTTWEPISRQAMGWEPLSGGVKLIVAGRVVEFVPGSNPGPVLAETGAAFAAKQVSLEEYRKTLQARVDELGKAIEAGRAAGVAKDGRTLVKLLEQRRAARKELDFENDAVLQAINSELIALHDYDALAQALPLGNVNELQRGFLTVEGREFLLRAIGDGKVDIKTRLACAGALPYQGAIKTGAGYSRDPKYLTWLATMAAENVAEPELCEALAGRVGGFGGWTGVSDPTTKDLADAMGILTTLYRAQGTGESVRFCIERAFSSNGAAAYEMLNSKCGPVISIVRRAKGERAAGGDGRSISAVLEYHQNFSGNAAHKLQAQAVIEGRGRAYDMAAVDGIDERDGWSNQKIEIPASAPAGKYRISFRFSEDGKVVGVSHYLEVETGG